jgi:hypothetical protein
MIELLKGVYPTAPLKTALSSLIMLTVKSYWGKKLEERLVG